MRTHTPRREGFALALAMIAIVVIGALIAGAFFASTQEMRVGRNTLLQTRAFASAEYGLNMIQRDWDKTPNLTMKNGAIFDTTYTAPGVYAHVKYTRLNNETFWIVSEGRAAPPSGSGSSVAAIKRTGAILRLRIPTVTPSGAMTVNGNVNLYGSPSINGMDAAPTGWTGCDTAQNKAGIAAPPTATIDTTQGHKLLVTGTPNVLRDSAAARDSTYIKFGDETWTTLAAQANIQLPTGKYSNNPTPDSLPSGYCNKTNTNNWGEPNRGAGSIAPCYNYFPIIHVAGNFEIAGNGRGQGILMVDGDLTVSGTFDWYGLVLVGDEITKGTGTAHLYGAVMSRNANISDGSNSSLGGNTTISYSKCALDKAMRGSAQVVQAKDRGWAELF